MSLRQIVLDTETTGLKTEDGHRVIEIGCIEMIDRKLTGRNFHYYLNPEREVEAAAQAIHGLSNQFLQNQPRFADIVQSFLTFVQGAELIIHNAPFDVGFINYEFGLLKQALLPIQEYCQIVDTLELARRIHAGQKNTLDALCKRYGVDLSKRELHGALLDASLLAQVYLAMTGGQGSLFGESVFTSVTGSMSSSLQPTQFLKEKPRLVILKADAQELSEHEQYLKNLAKKGKCAWQA